jgi:hypothetical protein
MELESELITSIIRNHFISKHIQVVKVATKIRTQLVDYVRRCILHKRNYPFSKKDCKKMWKWFSSFDVSPNSRGIRILPVDLDDAFRAYVRNMKRFIKNNGVLVPTQKAGKSPTATNWKTMCRDIAGVVVFVGVFTATTSMALWAGVKF